MCVVQNTFDIEYITVMFYSPVTTLLRANNEAFVSCFVAVLLGLEGRASSGGFFAVCDK